MTPLGPTGTTSCCALEALAPFDDPLLLIYGPVCFNEGRYNLKGSIILSQ